MEEEAKKTREIPRIDIYRAWCKGCGICAAFCPAGVLGRDEAGYPYVKEPDKCSGCGWCEMHCPDFAISVVKGKRAGDKGEEQRKAASTQRAEQDAKEED